MDKYIDSLAQKIAEKSKKNGNFKVYNAHEKRSYDNYKKTAREAGVRPLTLIEIRKKKQGSGMGILDGSIL